MPFPWWRVKLSHSLTGGSIEHNGLSAWISFGDSSQELDITDFQKPKSTGSSLLGWVVLLAANVSGAITCGTSTGSLTEHCLLGSRFSVRVVKNGSARRAVGISSLTGAFTFGSTANPEVVVKVLDGTPVNDWYWVFFSSLTSQDYEVRVTDTTSGVTKSYPSPGPSCGQADTEAF